MESGLKDDEHPGSPPPHHGLVYNSIHSRSDVSFPVISLPGFSGKYEKWISFRDAFGSLIIQNRSLQPIQWFHYLIGVLEAELPCLFEHIPVSNENFTLAWDLIYKWYQNTCLITSMHMKALLSLPRVNKESVQNIWAFISHMSNNLEASKALNIEGPLHELLLMQSALEHLDLATRQDWETRTSFQNFSTLNELKTFVRGLCQAIELNG
jgi:hypothetical protein